jgi:hypothetical protein
MGDRWLSAVEHRALHQSFLPAQRRARGAQGPNCLGGTAFHRTGGGDYLQLRTRLFRLFHQEDWLPVQIMPRQACGEVRRTANIRPLMIFSMVSLPKVLCRADPPMLEGNRRDHRDRRQGNHPPSFAMPSARQMPMHRPSRKSPNVSASPVLRPFFSTPTRRMPDMNLTRFEAADIAAYVGTLKQGFWSKPSLWNSRFVAVWMF